MKTAVAVPTAIRTIDGSSIAIEKNCIVYPCIEKYMANPIIKRDLLANSATSSLYSSTFRKKLSLKNNGVINIANITVLINN